MIIAPRHFASVLAIALLLGSGSMFARAAPAPKPAVAVSTSPDCGSVQIPKGDGSDWKCSFDDEFNGNTLDTSEWIAQTTAASGFHTGPECFVDSPNNISVADGSLNLTVRDEGKRFVCKSPFGDYVTRYTSGMVMTWNRFAQAYGRFEVRAKFPAAAVAGLQSSLWLWPQDPSKYVMWPWSGEIDIAEVYSAFNDRAIPFIHYVPTVYDANVTNNYCLLDPTQFHNYTLTWTLSTLTIAYDGKTCLVDNWNPAPPLMKPAPFDQPFIIALTQALGVGTNAFNPKTPLPATTQIDYVRVWS